MPEISSPEIWVVVSAAIVLLIIVYASARVCSKAGFSRWLGILSIIPIANIFLLFYLAFKDWPPKRRFQETIARDASSRNSRFGQAFA